ncbi:hypothetical protein MSG28_012827 [Choristoneura fumiferana]|uniref:Uncharacterized protein n=1 Tax=Choristoneura fumiferana TaxID=7141 RepID=A0ACC0JI25_CHOFU|nr:hypothetical protein MSG28_012827 [Choristoneura fumiferana]
MGNPALYYMKVWLPRALGLQDSSRINCETSVAGLSTHSISMQASEGLLALGALLAAAALYGYCRWRLGYWRRRGMPALPGAHWLLGHYGAGLLLRAPPAWLLARLYRAAPDQPLVGFYICHKPCLLLRDPLLVKRVLVTDFDAFADRNFAGEQQKDSFGMINLFGLRGPAWRYVRRRMAPALSASRMRAAVPAMLAATPRCWRGWRARRPRELGHRYAADLIARVALGARTDSFSEPDAYTDNGDCAARTDRNPPPSRREDGRAGVLSGMRRMVALVVVFFTPWLAALAARAGAPLYFEFREARRLFREAWAAREGAAPAPAPPRGDFLDYLRQLKEGPQNPLFGACPLILSDGNIDIVSQKTVLVPAMGLPQKMSRVRSRAARIRQTPAILVMSFVCMGVYTKYRVGISMSILSVPVYTVTQKSKTVFQDPAADGRHEAYSLFVHARRVPFAEFSGDNLLYQAGMFFSGFESSAAAATFLLRALARRPPLAARARDEVRRAVRDAGGWGARALEAMPLLARCLKEALRMHPPVASLDRRATTDYQIPGTDVTIERGTAVYISLSGLQLDARHFPEPHTFDPERFAAGRPVSDAYLPFGRGPHMCATSYGDTRHIRNDYAAFQSEDVNALFFLSSHSTSLVETAERSEASRGGELHALLLLATILYHFEMSVPDAAPDGVPDGVPDAPDAPDTAARLDRAPRSRRWRAACPYSSPSWTCRKSPPTFTGTNSKPAIPTTSDKHFPIALNTIKSRRSEQRRLAAYAGKGVDEPYRVEGECPMMPGWRSPSQGCGRRWGEPELRKGEGEPSGGTAGEGEESRTRIARGVLVECPKNPRAQRPNTILGRREGAHPGLACGVAVKCCDPVALWSDERRPLDYIESPARLGKMGRQDMGCCLLPPSAGTVGHGCFGKYLCKIARRKTTPMCHHCGGAEDTAQHTLQIKAVLGNDLSLPTVVKSMTDSERSWIAMAAFCEEVMALKEVAEREREEDPNSQPMRSRRGLRMTGTGKPVLRQKCPQLVGATSVPARLQRWCGGLKVHLRGVRYWTTVVLSGAKEEREREREEDTLAPPLRRRRVGRRRRQYVAALAPSLDSPHVEGGTNGRSTCLLARGPRLYDAQPCRAGASLQMSRKEDHRQVLVGMPLFFLPLGKGEERRVPHNHSHRPRCGGYAEVENTHSILSGRSRQHARLVWGFLPGAYGLNSTPSGVFYSRALRAIGANRKKSSWTLGMEGPVVPDFYRLKTVSRPFDFCGCRPNSSNPDSRNENQAYSDSDGNPKNFLAIFMRGGGEAYTTRGSYLSQRWKAGREHAFSRLDSAGC